MFGGDGFGVFVGVVDLGDFFVGNGEIVGGKVGLGELCLSVVDCDNGDCEG